MALGDPFGTTYAGAREDAQSIPQAVTGGLQFIQKEKQLQDQRKMAHDLLKQTGMLKEETIPPSVDELKSNLQQFGKQTGRNVNFNIAPNADENQTRKFLEGIHKAYGVPMPQGKTNTTLNLTPGTQYDPMSGDLSFKGEQKQLSPLEQVKQLQDAQRLLDTSGIKGEGVSTSAKGGVSIKPISQSTQNKEDSKTMAESYAQDVKDGKQTYDPKVYNYRDRGVYTEALRKQGIDVGQADLNYYSMQREAASLNGPTQTRLRQALLSTKETLPLLSKATEDLKASGINFTNMVDLKSKLNGLSPDQKNKAVAYMTQLTTLQDELGVTLQSGGVPTDMAKQMAKDIFNPFYSADKMETAIQQVGLNMDIRQKVIGETNPLMINAQGNQGAGVVKAAGLQSSQKESQLSDEEAYKIFQSRGQ